MSLCALLARPITFVPESSPSELLAFGADRDHKPTRRERAFSSPAASCLTSTTTISPTSSRRYTLDHIPSLPTQRQSKRNAAEAGLDYDDQPNKKQIVNSISSIRTAVEKPVAPSQCALAGSSGKTFPRAQARGYLNRSGTHCYRNASLQALGSVYEFRQLILDHTCDKNKKCVCCPLQIVFRDHYNSNGARSSPHEPPQLRTIAKSIGGTFAQAGLYRQEDAHEYIALLLDRLSTRGSKSSAEAVKTAINSIFTCTKITTIECLNSRCQQQSHTRCTEDSLIMLNIPELPSKKNGELDLNDCLRHYTRFEHVSDYKCEKCGNRGIKKKLIFEAPPKVAMIALSRFKIAWSGGRGKDRRKVKFPEVLDWVQFTQKHAGKSKLSAIVCHESSSLNSGHYYTIVRSERDGWLKYDDEHVASCRNPLDGFENKWYLLLYAYQDE
ncbi:ubiquitin carboxyl-terminal hydrolase [Orbilia brochopaga]|uniref:ubiquitinyl hydrolase 1 n=1 Tax=Orbilia brochopaga TaxID=3140254 RepID=A0AAV9UIH0_9PEZI